MNGVLNWRERFLLKGSIKDKCLRLEKQGYSGVDEENFLEYLVEYRWRKKQPVSLGKKKEDITNITANDFFDYLRLKAQAIEAKTFSWDDIEDLL